MGSEMCIRDRCNKCCKRLNIKIEIKKERLKEILKEEWSEVYDSMDSLLGAVVTKNQFMKIVDRVLDEVLNEK